MLNLVRITEIGSVIEVGTHGARDGTLLAVLHEPQVKCVCVLQQQQVCCGPVCVVVVMCA